MATGGGGGPEGMPRGKARIRLLTMFQSGAGGVFVVYIMLVVTVLYGV
jgi:hypothetical protein